MENEKNRLKKLGQALRDSLCKLNLKDLKGIIVDLRLNTGGNMYPMISGIAPLLGNGKAGSFVDNGKILNSWFIKDGNLLVNDNAYITLQNNCNPGKNIKIALLIGPATASSGEATAISFIGKKECKTNRRKKQQDWFLQITASKSQKTFIIYCPVLMKQTETIRNIKKVFFPM